MGARCLRWRWLDLDPPPRSGADPRLQDGGAGRRQRGRDRLCPVKRGPNGADRRHQPTIFGYNTATGTTTPLVRANERLVPNGIAEGGVLIYTQGDPATNSQALYRLVGVSLP